MSERQRRELQAYHDGELSVLGRWRVRRRLARDPAARRELAWLRETGALLREVDAEAETPDLWLAIRAELPAGVPVAVQERREGRAPALALGWLRWAAPAAGAALLVVALTFGLEWGDAPDGRSLRWLDTGGQAVLVLQDDREATIIWVLDEPSDRVSVRRQRGLG